MKMLGPIALAIAAAAALAGCGWSQPPPALPPGGPTFLQDGLTSREQVLLTLGLPSAQFEGERILAYRLAAGRAGEAVVFARVLTSASNRPAESAMRGDGYSLVLVFDARGVLERHAMIDLK